MSSNQPAAPSVPTMVPLGHPAKNSQNTTQMRCIPALTIFSTISILLGVASISLQILILSNHLASQYSFNVLGSGIWAGVLYLMSGILGLRSSSKKTRPLLVSTAVFSSLSIAAAASAAALSGILIPSIALYFNVFGEYFIIDEKWTALQWSLLSISTLAFVNSITLISLASVALSEPPVEQIMQPAYAVLANGYGAVHPTVYANQVNLPIDSTQAVQPIHSTLASRSNVQSTGDRQRQ